MELGNRVEMKYLCMLQTRPEVDEAYSNISRSSFCSICKERQKSLTLFTVP